MHTTAHCHAIASSADTRKLALGATAATAARKEGSNKHAFCQVSAHAIVLSSPSSPSSPRHTRCQACCSPYHRGDAPVPTPEALLRSRYSAYAAKDPQFIADTTHPDSPEYTGSRASYIGTCSTARGIRSRYTRLPAQARRRTAKAAVKTATCHLDAGSVTAALSHQGHTYAAGF